MAHAPEPVNTNAEPLIANNQPAANGDPAAVPRQFAVLSLIGDEFGFHRIEHMGKNLITSNKVSGPLFDQAALLAADEVLKKAMPTGTPMLVMPTAELYAAQTTLIVDGKFHPTAALDATLKAQHITQLIVITKITAPSVGRVTDSTPKGIGFILNVSQSIYTRETGESAHGYLVPYAHFKTSLVDVAQSTVLVERQTHAAKKYTTLGIPKIDNPWELRTPEENLELLKTLLATNVALSVSNVLKSSESVSIVSQ